MKWLAECSAAALRETLRVVAPELSEHPVPVPVGAGDDPVYHKATVVIGGQFIVKFAWSRPAAAGLSREISLLAALSREPAVPFLPEVVASSTDPVLLITRREPGASLYQVIDSIDREAAGRQLARFLAILHDPLTRQRTEAAVGRLTVTHAPPPTGQVLRDRVGRWVRPGQRRAITCWCDWADAVLSSAGPAVLVHGDFHGDNQVWEGGALRLVVDFESIGAAEPEYELRALPGPEMGPGVELLAATMRHYERATGRRLSTERVMAWNARQALGDVLWRSEAGLPMTDRRTPPEWVDDLAQRFSALGITC